MTVAIAKTETAELVSFSGDQLQLLKRTISNGELSDDQFALFMEVARRSGLDPFQRQIHAVLRKGRDGKTMTIQTGIDGYRLIARRNGLAGIDDIEYGQEIAADGLTYPQWARATVYRWGPAGERERYVATARWAEYVQLSPIWGKAKGEKVGEKVSDMWVRMPYGQLGKCAEALALRKGFQELSGLYTDDEMHQADRELQSDQKPVRQTKRAEQSDVPDPAPKRAVARMSQGERAVAEKLKAARNLFAALRKKHGVEWDTVKAGFSAQYGHDADTDDEGDVDKLYAFLDAMAANFAREVPQQEGTAVFSGEDDELTF